MLAAPPPALMLVSLRQFPDSFRVVLSDVDAVSSDSPLTLWMHAYQGGLCIEHLRSLAAILE